MGGEGWTKTFSPWQRPSMPKIPELWDPAVIVIGTQISFVTFPIYPFLLLCCKLYDGKRYILSTDLFTVFTAVAGTYYVFKKYWLPVNNIC